MGDQRSMFLTALDYPHADKFQVGDQASYRTLVAWLEDTKIRFLPVAERAALREVGAGAEWDEAFCKYLESQECPVDLRKTPARKPSAVDWLISQAVGFQYKDNAAVLNNVKGAAPAEGRAGGGGGVTAPSVAAFSDVGSDAFRAGLADLCALLGIPPGGSSLQQLRAIQTSVEAAAASAGAAVGGTPPAAHSGAFPLGFSVDGGKAVDKAASVLRMLYVQDLRELQTAVDRALVEVQEYTANPKTDAKLGKVGH